MKIITKLFFNFTMNFNIKDYTCSICASLFYQPVTLPCGHNICIEHVEDLNSPCCPCCRTNFATTPTFSVNKILDNIISTVFPSEYEERRLEVEQSQKAKEKSFIYKKSKRFRLICELIRRYIFKNIIANYEELLKIVNENLTKLATIEEIYIASNYLEKTSSECFLCTNSRVIYYTQSWVHYAIEYSQRNYDPVLSIEETIRKNIADIAIEYEFMSAQFQPNNYDNIIKSMYQPLKCIITPEYIYEVVKDLDDNLLEEETGQPKFSFSLGRAVPLTTSAAIFDWLLNDLDVRDVD